jgi:hypothetical protein
MRRFALVIFVVVFVCVSIGYGLKTHADKREQQRREQQKREAIYNSMLSSYSKDIEPGMTRAKVEDKLRAKAIPFVQSAEEDLVKIGEEAAPWFCSDVDVYVAFAFEAVEASTRPWESRPTDVLKRVHIYSRPDGCL